MHLRSPSRFATLKVRQDIRDDGLNTMEEEFLVYGGISAEEYRIVTCFLGDSLLNDQV
jgi:hypothetical protein